MLRLARVSRPLLAALLLVALATHDGAPAATHAEGAVAAPDEQATLDRALLETLRPVVEWSASGSVRWAVVPIQQDVQVGDRVRTGTGANARLVYPGGTVTAIGPETGLIVAQLDRQPDGTLVARMFQEVGSTITRIVQSAAMQITFEIETLAATARARGTTPELQVAPDGVSLIRNVPDGSESTVLVTGKDPARSQVSLLPGEETLVVPGQAPPPPLCQTGFRGEYFPNPDLQGAPTVIRCDPAINFDWAGGVPTPGLPNDYFSVRWTAPLRFPADGVYTFQITVDDGVRLYLDGQRLIDEWRNASSLVYAASVPVTAGVHLVVVEFLELDGDALIRVDWPVPTS